MATPPGAAPAPLTRRSMDHAPVASRRRLPKGPLLTWRRFKVAVLSAVVLVGSAFLLDEISRRWLDSEVGAGIMWMAIGAAVATLVMTTHRRRERYLVDRRDRIGEDPSTPLIAAHPEIWDIGDVFSGGDSGGGE